MGINTRVFFSVKICLITIFLVVFSLNFSFSSCQNFDNAEFITQSGGVSYKVASENDINLINNNITSHPLSIVLQKQSDQDCHENEDFALQRAGTIQGANAFENSELESGKYLNQWRFDFPIVDFVYANPYTQFEFYNTNNDSNSQVLNVKIDQDSPELAIESIMTSSGSYNLDLIQKSNDLKLADILRIEIGSDDDAAIENIGIDSIQGGTILKEEKINNSVNNVGLEAQINLTSSPLDITFRVVDKFGKEDSKSVSIPFDSYDPSIDVLDISSYEVNSNKMHSVKGEVEFRDDFEISSDDININFLSPNSNNVDVGITSCEFEGESESDLKTTTCSFRSEFISIDEDYETTFTIQVRDKVDNSVTNTQNKTIQIESSPPEISLFELRNSVNNTNIVSSNSEGSATIILEFSNELDDMYQNMLSSSTSSGQGSTFFPTLSEFRVDFGPFNGAEPSCEFLDDMQSQRCEWDISPELLASLNQEGEFNISVSLVDIIGNGVEEEITIEIENSIPQITSFELVERGNERNTVFESNELVRMQIFVEGVSDRIEEGELELFTTGSAILFKQKPEDVTIRCEVVDYETESETYRRCFSNDFELNQGFDGDRSEPLNVNVLTPSGNLANASIDVKIFKNHEGESVNYYDFKSSRILNPLNRRVVSQEGVDTYHSFSIEPKNNNEEYSIVSIEVLGQGDGVGDEMNDVRLRNFELQNQTSQGVVLGNNNDFFIKSFMSRLLSAYEMENTNSSVMISIVKKDIDTIYKDENMTVPLPIEFYDMPRDVNSNIALAEKLLDNIEGVSESRREGDSLYDIYNTYYDICRTYNLLQEGVQTISASWNTISRESAGVIPGSELIDELVSRTGKTTSLLGNIDGIMGKMCILASCQYSQDLIGGALDSISGDSEVGSYLTGQKNFLGNSLCKLEE